MNAPAAILPVILVTAACTLFTRVLPFLLFGRDRPVPETVRYLGRVLPAAIMAALVVYCLKDVWPAFDGHGLSALCGVAVTALLHAVRRNSLISIAGGTAAYMLLIRFVFPV